MKKITSVISLSFLVPFLLVTTVMGSDDWVEYGRMESIGIYLYNKDSIKHPTNDMVQVTNKLVLSDKGRELLIKMRRSSSEKFEKSSYMTTKYNIYCKKDLRSILSITVYDKNGHVLSDDSNREPIWGSITPDTMDDKLRKKVCK